MTVLSKKTLKIINSIEYDTVSALLIGFIVIITLSMRSLRSKTNLIALDPFLPQGIRIVLVITSTLGQPLCDSVVGRGGVKNTSVRLLNIDYTTSKYTIIPYEGIYSCNSVAAFNSTRSIFYDFFNVRTEGAGNEYLYAIEEDNLSNSDILEQFRASLFTEAFPLTLPTLPGGIQSIQVLTTKLCNTGSGSGLNGFESPTRYITLTYPTREFREVSYTPSPSECTQISEFGVTGPIQYNTFYQRNSGQGDYFYAMENYTTMNDLFLKFSAIGFYRLL